MIFSRKTWRKVGRLSLRAAVVFAVLVAAWLVLEAVWDRNLFGESEGAFAKNVGSSEAVALMDKEPGLQIIDVRPPYERWGGRLPDALCLPSGGDDFEEKLRAEIDSSKPVLVYCMGGFRSRLAVGKLKDAGFKSIYHLDRGMLGWKIAGHPVVSVPAAE